MARTWTREHAINLQTRRKAQRWTLDQLATRANLTVEVVQQLERANEMDIEDEEVLRQLATALGVLPKQLCNSPLRPDSRGSSPAPALTNQLTAASVDSEGKASVPASRSGAWAVATVGLILVAAALLPSTCQRYSSSRDPGPIIGSQPIKILQSTRGTKTPSAKAPQPATDPMTDPATLLADLTGPASLTVSERLAASMQAPMTEASAALEQQATTPASPVAERLVMLLVLGADPESRNLSLARFLEVSISEGEGHLPWPAPAIEAAIALGAADASPTAAPTIEALLDNDQLPSVERTTLKDALERAKRGAPTVPAESPAMAPEEPEPASSTRSLKPGEQDLLAPDDSTADEDSAEIVDPFGAFLDRMQSESTTPATITETLALAREAAAAGNQEAVCAQLAAWLKRIPSDHISTGEQGSDLWRRLAWVIFPADAPVWEQAFGVEEERWMILVVAKLLDGAAG